MTSNVWSRPLTVLLRTFFFFGVVFSSCSCHANQKQQPARAVDGFVARFGIVTDVHYADVDPIATRFYRDSLAKMRQATAHFSGAGCDFIIELGDFKDTDAVGHQCDKAPSPICTNLTMGFLKRIEHVMHSEFHIGPKYHIFGNHDVDILNQFQVINNENNGPIDSYGMCPGVYSWSNDDSSLKFIALNGDFTSSGESWEHLDFPSRENDEKWNKANVPPDQIYWLENQLDEAAANDQKVIMFVHYRLDGGPDGPVGAGLGPPFDDPKNRPWVDLCTLQNAADVRRILETRHPGLVLAVFSGHDHKPDPPWTQLDSNKPVYFTHAAMVEGSWPESNAYSIVSIDKTCSIEVQGYANARSARFPGPANCTLLPVSSSTVATTG